MFIRPAVKYFMAGFTAATVNLGILTYIIVDSHCHKHRRALAAAAAAPMR